VDPDQITMVIQEVDAQLNDLSATLGGGEVRFEERVDQKVKAWTTGVVNMAPGLLGLITNVILVPFMAVFLLRDGPRIKRGLIRFVPNRYFEFSLEALHKIDIQLGNYFRGLVLEISIVSVLSIASLWILGVPAYVLVGLLAGITTVIPYAGSLLGGSIGILIKLASTGSISAAALVLVAFLAIQIADEALIQPLVFAQAVDLHPLEVLIAVWVAAQFFGVVGMVLAIPVTSAGKVVVAEGGALIQQYQFS
jgi:putative permease